MTGKKPGKCTLHNIFYLLLNNSELFLWYQPTLSDITVNSMPMQMMVAKQFEL